MGENESSQWPSHQNEDNTRTTVKGSHGRPHKIEGKCQLGLEGRRWFTQKNWNTNLERWKENDDHQQVGRFRGSMVIVWWQHGFFAVNTALPLCSNASGTSETRCRHLLNLYAERLEMLRKYTKNKNNFWFWSELSKASEKINKYTKDLCRQKWSTQCTSFNKRMGVRKMGLTKGMTGKKKARNSG